MIRELSRIVAETKEDLEQIRRQYKICDDTELPDVCRNSTMQMITALIE